MPGLAAKPVIDIMVGVKSLDDSPILVERLVGIGCEYVPEFGRVLPFRRYFRKMKEGGAPTRSTSWRDLTSSGGIATCSFATTCGRTLPRHCTTLASKSYSYAFTDTSGAAEPYFLPKDGWLPRWHPPALAIGWSVKYPRAREELPDENQ